MRQQRLRAARLIQALAPFFGQDDLVLWRGGGPLRRFSRAASRGAPSTGVILTWPSPALAPSAVLFTAAMKRPAAVRGISNIVSLAAMRIAPICVLVTCPRRQR